MRPSSVPMRPVLAVLALALALPAAAVRQPAESVGALPDLDVRLSRGARLQSAIAVSRGAKPRDLVAGPGAADPGPVRRAAVAALEAVAGPVEVRWDDVTGSPRLLFGRVGALTPADARTPETIARDFVLAHRDLFLLDPAQVQGLRLSRLVPSSDGGAVVRFQQSIAGIDVLGGGLAVSVTADGRILHVMGGRVTGAGELRSATPQSDPTQAMRALAAAAGVELAVVPVPHAGPGGSLTFRPKELREPARVERTVIPTYGGPRLGWQADVYVAGSPMGYAVAVDDATLAPVRRATRTWFLDTRGRVFTSHPGTSSHEMVRFTDAADYRFDRSPAGWSDETFAPLETVGNNVIVQDDIANDDEATPGTRATAAAPAPYWSFDHPFTGGGPADLQASLTNLFYGINWSHDRFHDLGFDERSGNFQADNFGRGGLGGDAVLGDDMDGSGTDNANFQTPPDGFPGRMQMYIWNGSGQERSSSFETGIVIHELGHGVSTRLVGGPDEADCLLGFQSGAMGEAWSDYFAASFLEDPVIGEWVSGNPRGIRMFRLDENPATGKDYRDFCGYGSDQQPFFCEPHDNGEIWSGLLWLIRDAYRAQFGDAEGTRRADQLVMDGMKYTACDPSMLDARDGLVLADRMQTGGQMECVIKSLAASRHMGFNASSTGGSDAEPTAGNLPWPECTDRGALRFDREGLDPSGARASYGCDDEVRILLTDGNYVVAPDAVTVVVFRAAAEVDRELVSPAAGAGVATYSASLRTSAAPGAPGDGVLQVLAGDEIHASYLDAAPGGSVATTQADVACAAKLRVVRHRVVNGTCDADEVPGFPELPGFVDAGETADIYVELANLSPQALAGGLEVVSDTTMLEVLPVAPIPVSFPAAAGTSPASVTVRLRAVGDPAASPGDVANLTFTLLGPQFDGTPSATLRLELAYDYELEAGLSAGYDVEAESAPAGPEWGRGELVAGGNNQWTVVTCQNTSPGGTKAFRNGPASCSGRYSDNQGDPWLTTPALPLFDPGTRAARITSVQWQNNVNLGVAGFPPTVPSMFDSDAVIVMAMNDPSTLDTSNPLAVATNALAAYIKIDVPGVITIDENTTGWELDQRPIFPGQLSDVDFSQATYLTWYFLPDFPFVQPPLDAQGNGYYLDDVAVFFERVRVVPQAAACTPEVAVLALGIVSDPPSGSACSGSLVTVTSLSEAARCGPPAIIEHRFLREGLPVACLETDGVTPRAQDAEGWGLTTTCTGTVLEDSTFVVEIRCAASPATTDSDEVRVRVLDGLPLISGSQRAFCGGSGATITLDATASSLVGCPGRAEYRFEGVAGPLDCDGDMVPDDWSAAGTCVVGPSDVDLDVTVSVRCDALPGCALSETTTIPAVTAAAVAAEGSTAPGGFYCDGSTATLDASGSVVTGCASGTVQYRWTSTGGGDTGWIATPTRDVPVTADDDWSLRARCSLSPACVSAPDGPVAVRVRTGSFTLGQSTRPDDCAGDLFRLEGGVQVPPGARCASTIEYRFVGSPSFLPVTCFDDAGGATPRTQDAAGWGSGATCWTPHVAGGGDFVAEYRCADDPSCVMETSNVRTIVPRTGLPAGTNAGRLLVRKPAGAAGCVPGADVLLSWGDTDHVPAAFVVYRADDPELDMVADRRADVDDVLWADPGAECDGGGAPYRDAAVYFYLHFARNGCTGEPIP